MKGEQIPAHGCVWNAELDVALNAAQQCGVVVLEQVCGHDHHAIESVEFLHHVIAVLTDHLSFARTAFMHPEQNSLVPLSIPSTESISSSPIMTQSMPSS